MIIFINAAKKKHYKKQNVQTNFSIRYLGYNHKKMQIDIETFTVPSTREKETIQQCSRH